MTETSMSRPGGSEPLILERLSDLEDQEEYLIHYPDVRGCAVVNPAGDEVGMVDDLYVNPRNRQVEMAAITFCGPVGYSGKRALVPVEELQFLEEGVRIVTQEERIRLAPEFEEGGPMYESYYEYWANQPGCELDEPSSRCPRPPGRLEIEGEDEAADVVEVDADSIP